MTQTLLVITDAQNIVFSASIGIFLAFLRGVFISCYTHRNTGNRQQLEMELEQKSNYISTILNTASTLVVVLDLDRKIVSFNRACEQTTGYLCEQVSDKYIWELLLLPEDVEIWQSVLSALVMERLPITLETYWMTKKGDRRLISWTLAVLGDRQGAVKCLICTGMNISTRQQVKQNLQKTTRLQNAILDSANYAIIATDIEGTISTFNLAAQKLLGYSSQEIVGKTTPSIFHDSGEVVKRSQLVFKFLFDDTNANPLLGEVAIDITQLKQAEEQTQAALYEKEILLKEVHHRVKNNLQVIDSLFRHQCRQANNDQVVYILKECQNRVASMALLHEKLYHSKNLSKINFADYIKSLSVSLFNSHSNYGNSPKIKVNFERVFLDFDLALNCGLIINELVTNSLKYNFPDVSWAKLILIFLSQTFMINGVGFSMI